MLEMLYIVLPSLAIAAFVVVLAYFSALQRLAKVLRAHGPALLTEYGRGHTTSSQAFAVLNALRARQDLRARAAPEVLAASGVAYRRLVVALICILALFAVGLTISVAKA
jgi:hypothetical protein